MDFTTQLQLLSGSGGMWLFVLAVAFAILFVCIAEWNSRRH